MSSTSTDCTVRMTAISMNSSIDTMLIKFGLEDAGMIIVGRLVVIGGRLVVIVGWTIVGRLVVLMWK